MNPDNPKINVTIHKNHARSPGYIDKKGGCLMNTPNFVPLNPVEKSLIKAKKGEITLPELIQVLLSNKLFVPSVEVVDEKGEGFVPLLFDRDGTPMAAVFTDKSRADAHKSRIKDLIVVSFKDVLNNIPENYGLVINPGYTEGLELLSHGIKNIRRDFMSS